MKQDSKKQQNSVDSSKEEVNREHSLGIQKGQRILGHKVTRGFNNTNIQQGQEISAKDSEDVHRNLDVQDQLIEEAKRIRLTGYGFRHSRNAKMEYSDDETRTTLKALQGWDCVIPNFRKAKNIMPERSGLLEVPYDRFDAQTEKVYSDQTIKALYVKKEGMSYAKIGKESVPYSQPIISHEFIEDAIYELGDQHKQEWEIVPDLTFDDKKGYRRYWGILSKRLDREITGSFRIGDVVRIGALVRNGIAEATSVGFDLFTYCVTCQNGSVGRSKELGSEAWKHAGALEKLQEKILGGLEDMFNIGQEFLDIYEQANYIPMDDEMVKRIWERTHISNKYFEEAEDKKHRPYFQLIRESEKSRKIDEIKLARDITLWEGYNALTAPVWHSDEMAFGKKAAELRRLNDELVAIVKPSK
jgi:hypothetical protein